MIKKLILVILVMSAAVTLVFATSENPSQNPTNSNINQSITPQNQINDSNSQINESGSSKSSSDNTNQISPNEAKQNAQKYVIDPTANTGTPTISKIDDKTYYAVPVNINGTNVGEIDIDPKTGKNVGGAGGAPGPT